MMEIVFKSIKTGEITTLKFSTDETKNKLIEWAEGNGWKVTQ